MSTYQRLDYFVSRIELVPHEPKACATCGKENLMKNVVIEDIGIDTFLCACGPSFDFIDHFQIWKRGFNNSQTW